MEVANTRLVLNKLGSCVPVNEITPPEAMFLHILHGAANGGKTFGDKMDNFEIVGSAKVKEGDKLRDRTDIEELIRLRRKYTQARNKDNKPIIDLVWPDRNNVKFPQTFKELKWSEISAANAGVEVAAPNYATGGVATAALLTK